MTARIGMVIDSLIGGGAERVALSLAAALTATGARVEFFLLQDRVEHELGRWQGTIHILSQDSPLPAHPSLRKRALARRLLKRVAAEEATGGRFDAFFTHSEDADRITRLARLHDTTVVYHNSMRQYLESKVAHRSALKRALRRWRWLRRFRKEYSGRDIVTVSQAVAREMVEELGVKPRSITTIYNPVDFSLIQQRACDPAPDLPRGPFVLCVAKLERRKRQDLILHAFARAAPPTHRLVLLGGAYTADDQAWRAGLLRLATELGLGERLVLPGFAPNPYPWMRAADLLVLASDSEGLGMVLVEALSLGTPVISTDCRCGPNEILLGPLARYLSDPGDAEGLAKNMAAALAGYPSIAAAQLKRFESGRAARAYLAHIRRTGAHG